MGISPFDIEQVVIVFGYPQPRRPFGRPQPFNRGMIVRTIAPHGGEKLVAKLLAPDTPVKSFVPRLLMDAPVNGSPPNKSYYHPKNKSGGVACIALIDDRTYLVADEPDLWAMLGVQTTTSPLAAALEKGDFAADVSVVVANRDEIRNLVAAMKANGQLPTPLAAFSDLIPLLNRARLTIKTMPDISLTLALETHDAAETDKAAALILPTVKKAIAAIAEPIRSAPRAQMPADQKEFFDFFLRKLDKIVAEIMPRQSGGQVIIDASGLGTVDQWAAKSAGSIAQARAAIQRNLSFGNLGQLGMALVLTENKNSKLPPRAIFSTGGKPLLSWRVAILPLLGEQTLFDQFRRDESWDSEHNRALIAKMPDVFADPRVPDSKDWRTRYVVPTGPGTVFEADKGCKYSDITNGGHSTLLVVEVGSDKSVIWTKPDDMEFDPQQPIVGLGTIPGDSFLTFFADGHVQAIRKSIDAETMRRLVDRNTKSPVEPVWLQPGVSEKPER